MTLQEKLEQEYYLEKDVAAFMGIGVSTLRKRVYTGQDHPPCKKMGAQWLYPKKEFHAWEKSKPLVEEARAM